MVVVVVVVDVEMERLVLPDVIRCELICDLKTLIEEFIHVDWCFVALLWID